MKAWNKFFPADKILIQEILFVKVLQNSKVSKEDALNFFGLDQHKPTVLIVGGSLGARSINEVIAQHIGEFNPLDLQLIWQTGKATAKAYLRKGKSTFKCVGK